MSSCSSPGGGYETDERAMRLSVRKDLFPTSRDSTADELDSVSCVKLVTDFEQSIDAVSNHKVQLVNGLIPEKKRHKKHKRKSRHSSERSSKHNGRLPSDKSEKKRRKSSQRETRSHSARVKGGKNLNLVCYSGFQNESDESSEDEVLGSSVKIPVKVVKKSGKPYSHELSQFSIKKSKSKDKKAKVEKVCKERISHVVVPCSGKPRAMLDICSSKKKKKSKKHEKEATTYSSQIVQSDSLKLKIRRTSFNEKIVPLPLPVIPPPKKPKKKRNATPVVSDSSGEEYDPSRGDTPASMSVAAPKPRHPPAKARKSTKTKTTAKTKVKGVKTESVKASGPSVDPTPQSPWGASMPEEVLVKIFGYVVSSQGTLPSVIRLGRVCKLWHTVSCRPELWKSVDLAHHTHEKHKIDYRLVWLLENRLSQCHTLNLANWKVGNMSWVVSSITECAPALTELGLAGWCWLASEHLHQFATSLPKLARLDLSHTSETGGSGSCLSAASVARVAEVMGSRLTHLTVANNKFTALHQILTSIASRCANLEVLDISGARAVSHPAAVPLEALQRGCPLVRVFRAANAQLVLSPLCHAQEAEAAGWCHLEEVSVAGEAASERVAVGEYRLGDDALARLVRGATRLRLLDLRGLQRLTHSGLVRVPAWDLQHLFLGGSNVSRQSNSGLELICEKWSHSLVELDLSWATAARALGPALDALADTYNSKLRILNLCGSSVSLEPVKKVLAKCKQLESLNLSSCRAMPRGMKRLYAGEQLRLLRESFFPDVKIKEEPPEKVEDLSPAPADEGPAIDTTTSNVTDVASPPSPVTLTTSLECSLSLSRPHIDTSNIISLIDDDSDDLMKLTREAFDLLPSPPGAPPPPDSSSTPRSDPPAGPPLAAPSAPDHYAGSWNLGRFKSRYGAAEQCSPTTSQEPAGLAACVKQEAKHAWNYGGYSPMPARQDGYSPYSGRPQPSPYSAQPSPAQPSPYSAQPSPYSAQPSPYSAQPSPYSARQSPYSQASPYSAQPSPDTSQMVKQELPKWAGGYSPSPVPKPAPAPFSPDGWAGAGAGADSWRAPHRPD